MYLLKNRDIAMAKSGTLSNRIKTKYKTLNSTTQSLIKFLGITALLILFGLLYHFNTDQNIDATEKFFEYRKNVQEYHQYQEEEEDAKKRAERNIFLQ